MPLNALLIVFCISGAVAVEFSVCVFSLILRILSFVSLYAKSSAAWAISFWKPF